VREAFNPELPPSRTQLQVHDASLLGWFQHAGPLGKFAVFLLDIRCQSDSFTG